MHSPVPLRFASRTAARLRELTGEDERRVGGANTEDGLRLIEALLVEPLVAEDLVAADRDQILAVIYRETFGDRIESTVRCAGCGNAFDLHFSLTELNAAATRPSGSNVAATDEGVFQAPAGWRFRLPTGRDERDAGRLSETEAVTFLLRRCLDQNHVEAVELEAVLDEIAPLLELDLQARCPECEHVRLFEFDIQTYLLRSLLNERPRLATDIHCLAREYGWSLNEILSLTRSERRRMVQLIENESRV